jgi:tetratricopeptide (TPR) repeat protein
VSKLFNTLEQIRRHETFRFHRHPFPAPRPAAKGQAGRRWVLATVLLLTMTVLATGGRLLRDFHLPTFSRPGMTAATPAPATPGPAKLPAAGHARPETPESRPHLAAPANGSPRERQLLALNDKGVEAAGRGDYWQAVHFFKKASELQPGRPEPLINLGVVLIRLDLPVPARRAFEEAYAAAPADPRLRQNLEMLAAAGLLDGKLAEAVTAARAATVETGG